MARKPPANIEARLQEVAKEIAKGSKRSAIITKYCKKFQVSERTVDTYIKKAQIIVADLAKTKQQAEKDAIYEYEKEEVKRNLLTRDEKREILAKIARGETTIVKTIATKDGLQDIEMLPDHNDRIKAIDIDAKMEGDFAPKDINLSGNVDFGAFLKKRENGK